MILSLSHIILGLLTWIDPPYEFLALALAARFLEGIGFVLIQVTSFGVPARELPDPVYT